MYLAQRPMRRRRLGQLIFPSVLTGGYGATGPTVQAPDSIPWYCSYLLYMPWLGSYSSCVAPAIASGPASVATNAQTFYGSGSPPAQAASSAAAVQEASAASDAAAISSYYDPYSLSGYNATPSAGLPWWAWLGLAAGAAVIIGKAL